MEKRLKKIVDANFKLYPKREEQYIFTDGVCFFRKSQADDYAKSTKKEYETAKRELEKADDKGQGGDGSGADMTAEQANEILKGLELNKEANYELLGNLIATLELVPEGKSKDDRIKVLEPVKALLTEGSNQ